jgi:hypothetical protein
LPSFEASSRSAHQINRSTEPRSPIAATYQCQRPSRVFRRNPVDQHVRLWRDNRRIDKAKKEKSTDKRANRYVGSLRIFSLPFLLRKNSQIKEQTDGRTRVRLRICLHIQRIPYGTSSKLSMMVTRKLFAISINMVNLGAMMACTSGLVEAISGGTPRGRFSGREPVSSSIWLIICS